MSEKSFTSIASTVALRALALASALLFALFPVASALLAPDTSLRLKVCWLALFVLGLARPRWGAFAFIALAPLTPWLPYTYRHVPNGIIHLLVLSQALPLLLRLALGRAALPPRSEVESNGGTGVRNDQPRVATPASVSDGVLWAWALLVCLAVASVFTEYATQRIVFDSFAAFWVELRDHLSRYVFERPNVELSNMLVAASTYVDGLLVFLIIRWNIGRAEVRPLLWTMAGAGVAVALFGFYQAQTHLGLSPDWLINDPDIIRINSTYSDPNALASYFSLLIPLAIGLAAAEMDLRRRLLWAAGAVAMTIALVMTAGRAGMFGAIGGLAILAIAALRLRLHEIDAWAFVRRYYRPAFWLVTGASILLLCLFVIIGTALDIRHFDQHSYLYTWLYTFNLRQRPDLIAKGRFSIWETALLMIKDNPIFGIGVGRIFRLFAGYNRLAGGAFEDARFSAHNTFLNVTAELGIVGLLTWLALLIATFTAGWRAVKQAAVARDGAAAWLALGAFAGLCGYTLTMMTGDRLVLREDVVLFAAVSAVLVILGGRQSDHTARMTQKARLNVPTLSTLLAMAIVATIPLRAAAERQQVRLDRVFHGMYDVETQQNVPFRWTRDHAVFHTSAADASLSMDVRTLAPFTQAVEIQLDGVTVDRLSLNDHAWHRVTYRLPQRATETHGYHRVDLIVSPTWHPPTDDRDLGVMLAWPVTPSPR